MADVVKVTRRTALSLVLAALSLLASAAPSYAQSSLDNGTPAESKRGTTNASSYAPDKLETVNLANGNLSMNIPLATVGGRGSASFTIALTYNSKLWSSEHEREENPHLDIEPPTYTHHYNAWYDEAAMSDANDAAPGGGWKLSYGPALRRTRVKSGANPCSGINSRNTCYQWLLTKLSLTLPDGSEVELRDQYTQGAPHYLGGQLATAADRWRGRVWVTTDGSAATFVSDTDNGVVNNQLAGWVFLSDGTRIRMDADQYGESAHCTRITDRQGNFVTIDRPANGSTLYTDELGRQVVVAWATPNVLTVTAKGYAGVPDRVVTINTDRIGAADASGVLNNLRSDFRSLPRPFTSGDYARLSDHDVPHTIAGPHTDLFDGSESADNIDDHFVVTRVDLPDGHKIGFRYNQYGEVAEVIYPGGGVSQIDYQGFTTTQCQAITPFAGTLNRRVAERRLYTDGANLDATWTYAGAGTTVATLEARQGDRNGALLLSEKHYLMAVDAEYRTCRVTQTGDRVSDGTHYERWDNNKEYRVERQVGNGGVQVMVRQWQQRAPVAYLPESNATYTQEQPANDPRVVWEETTLEDGRKRRVEYTYDDFNNVTSEKEYDFGDTTGSTGALLRQTFRTYATNVNGYCYSNLNGTDGSCGVALASDVGTIIHQRRRLLNQTVKDGAGNQEAYSEVEYDNYSSDGSHAPLVVNSGMVGSDGARFANFSASSQPRGNATRTAAWAGGSSYLYSYARYDDAGNVVSTKDPRGIESFVSYADQFTDGVGRSTFAFATATTSAVPDPTNQRGTNTPLTSSTVYEYATGQARSATDANGKTTLFQYNDPLNRVTRVDRPDGGWTTYAYGTSTSAGQPSDYVRTQTALDGTRSTDTYQFFDMLGRPSRTFLKVDNSSTPFVTTDTQYDALGRAWRASNPYLAVDPTSAINPPGRWTANAYDLAGRVTSVTTPDGATVTTAYFGNQVTVTDQAGKQRRSVSDALGRLVRVDEPDATGNLGAVSSPAQPTYYSYDALGNLRKVDQGGQQRFFMYDSLGRLIRAKNPEQTGSISADADFPALTDSTSGTPNSNWSMGYTYNADGNLYKRKDARNTVTTYQYDAINRVIRTDYSDGITPYTLNTYDFAANGRGRYYMDYESSPTGTINFVGAYDVAGRPTSRVTQFFVQGTGWSPYYTMARTYDLASDVTSETYPSGHTVNYSYDAAGRLGDNGLNLAFTGNLGDGTPRTYSSGLTYDEASRLQQERFGTDTPLYHKLHYNVRGQLMDVRLSTAAWQQNGAGQWDWNRGALVSYYSQNEINSPTNAGRLGSGPENNGNLKRSDAYVPTDAGGNYDGVNAPGGYFTAQDSYSYDALNRLSSVSEANYSTASGWGAPLSQAYSYDRWGNRQIDAAGTSAGVNSRQFTIDAVTNRLYGLGGGMGYDATGNLTSDTYSANAAQRAYDAENRMTLEQNSATSIFSRYTYDATGKRTRREVGGVVTWQVYGFDGELLAEYANGAAPASPQKEYGYRGGELLVTAAAGGQSAQPVAWQNAAGVSVAGNSLTKNVGDAWGNAGAASTQSIASGDGYVEFTASEISYRMCGLSNGDSGQSYTDIDFAIYPGADGTLQVYEGGIFRGSFGAYVAGDRLRVSVEGGVVKYRRNGALLYTSTVAPTYPLLVDTSLYSSGSTITNATISGAGPGQGGGAPVNVASASNGATATATSEVLPGYPASKAINGDRIAADYDSGGTNSAWAATGQVPATTQNLVVDFGQNRIVTEVDVFSLQDNHSSPTTPTLSMTGGLYVLTAFSLDYWDGSAWLAIPGASVTGNDKIWKQFTFSAITTTKIRLNVTATGDTYVRVAELEAYGVSAGGGQPVAWQNAAGVSVAGNSLTKNVGDAWGNAGAASTQSIASGDGYVEFTAGVSTDNAMCGLSNGDSGQSYTDIDFAVYVTAYGGNVVQVYEGGTWKGNFGAFAAGDRFRVAVEGGVVKYYRVGAGGALSLFYTSTVAPTYPLLADTALYTNGDQISNVVMSTGSGGGGAAQANVEWLVSDHLGTPRMVIDQTGSLSGVKRHDYLPFGEELFAGTGGRTTNQGYSGNDNVRQKFTKYERDLETGLDYAQARYYSSMQGRFTSVDPLLESGNPVNPKSWNRYSYSYNNPLRFTDPSGMIVGDFYDREGNFVASDGIKDDKIYLLNEGHNATDFPCSTKVSGETLKQLQNASTEVGALIVMTRTEEGDDYTIGQLKTIGGVTEKDVSGYTLEPAGPDTVAANQDKRIPAGVYNVGDYASDKFPDNFIISNGSVSEDRKILIHTGNNGSNTEGCIMVGGTKGEGSIGDSKSKMQDLRTFIHAEGASNVKLIIKNKIN